MKIVVLDGQLLNPGDLSWEKLRSLGVCEIYERTPPELFLERCRDADILITNKVPVTKERIDQLPRLRYIGVTATGYDNIDVQAAQDKGIIVTNVPNYSTASVAQHTIALLLAIVNTVDLHRQAVQSGEWVRSPRFLFLEKKFHRSRFTHLGNYWIWCHWSIRCQNSASVWDESIDIHPHPKPSWLCRSKNTFSAKRRHQPTLPPHKRHQRFDQ